MIYVINTILLVLFTIWAILPLAYCIVHLIEIAKNKENLKTNDNLIFWFCCMYFLACSFIIFRLLWFG